MAQNLEVSFNSPQCGWMSVGFEDEAGEFHTTTAHAPHTGALADIMDALSASVGAASGDFVRTVKWNRDPEEYDFVFSRSGNELAIGIYEYPTGDRLEDERRKVFSHTGTAREVAAAFYETFRQLYEERGVDDFKQNWHQEFPFESFNKLRNSIAQA